MSLLYYQLHMYRTRSIVKDPILEALRTPGSGMEPLVQIT